MSRKKNYNVDQDRAADVVVATTSLKKPTPTVDDTYIDLRALLGPDARSVANRHRVMDFRDWLGRGIDDWVYAVGFCIKAMLRSGSRTVASTSTYFVNIRHLFEYLTSRPQTPVAPRATTPSALTPLHVQHFIGWLENRAHESGWTIWTLRTTYNSTKTVLSELIALGFIPGEPSRFFKRGAIGWRGGESRQVSLSDAEQERLAKAIKSDLVAIHHDRLILPHSELQGLRLLLVAHRQGLNPTPLLEMRRDAVSTGFLPGTIRVPTTKYRGKRIRSSVGRASRVEQEEKSSDSQDFFFDLSEGAVLQQAIASTRDLLPEAPPHLQHLIWLYRAASTAGATQIGSITCLNASSLTKSISRLTARHELRGDDGLPMRVNLSRLRKSRFDRALRAADGDIAITANLMGNTPRIAASHYPSMNAARKAEAAGFMNNDYTALMRTETESTQRPGIRPVAVHPLKAANGGPTYQLPAPTPVSRCKDTVGGEFAPHDGLSHCDRYVMCLFCSSFAIVGTAEELWRLFSFQAFARAELEYLEEAMGQERTTDGLLEDLRDRYRVAIPYIDDFTHQQFAASRVAQARAKTAAGLHPYWQHQMMMSRRARSRTVGQESGRASSPYEMSTGGRFAT